jgi:hypothetical protein
MNSGPSPLPELAAFQAALLDVLHAGGTPEEMRARLLGHEFAVEFVDYIRQFDDRMLLVAAELVQKWGRR